MGSDRSLGVLNPPVSVTPASQSQRLLLDGHAGPSLCKSDPDILHTLKPLPRHVPLLSRLYLEDCIKVSG